LSQKSGNNPPTNPRKYQVQPAQVVSSSPPVTASIPSSNSFQPNNIKSKFRNKPPQDLGGSNFWVFFILFIFFGALFIYLFSDENNQQNTTLSPSNPASTSSQVYNCSNLNLPYMTTEQICDRYHTNKYPSCNSLFSAELISRERKLYPVYECGQPRSSISQNTSNSSTSKPTSIIGKINFLSNVSTSSVISLSSISHNSDAIDYFIDVSNDVSNKLSNHKSNSIAYEEGKVIFKNINITNISSFKSNGHNGDCSTPSLGTVEICLVKDNDIICELVNKNISFETYCFASFISN